MRKVTSKSLNILRMISLTIFQLDSKLTEEFHLSLQGSMYADSAKGRRSSCILEEIQVEDSGSIRAILKIDVLQILDSIMTRKILKSNKKWSR